MSENKLTANTVITMSFFNESWNTILGCLLTKIVVPILTYSLFISKKSDSSLHLFFHNCSYNLKILRKNRKLEITHYCKREHYVQKLEQEIIKSSSHITMVGLIDKIEPIKSCCLLCWTNHNDSDNLCDLTYYHLLSNYQKGLDR